MVGKMVSEDKSIGNDTCSELTSRLAIKSLAPNIPIYDDCNRSILTPRQV
jgi:hypothetical protein